MQPGDRVKLHPSTEWWMKGAIYGRVHLVGGTWAYVKVEVLGKDINRIVRFRRDTDLIEIAQ